MDHLRKILRITIWCIIDICILAAIAIAILIIHVESELPDVAVLKDVKMQVPLRIYTSDGKLIAEYGEKRRIPVAYDQIPPQLINAVLATEDQRFFEHPGVDIKGLLRAAVQVALTGKKVQGGSTITMQVARNFFLSPKKTYTRKVKEILLAIKIDQELSKQKILDLYLNKIYFGNRAYGVGAAAQAYYGKPLNQLTLPEIAMLAGLPKAPTGMNPLLYPKAAFERRNHVLSRMYEHQFIDEATYEKAIKTPLTAAYHELPIDNDAPYVAEMVRNAMVRQFGAEKAYTSGFNVYTTVNSHLQDDANAAVDNALLAYDRRHGYRGPLKNLGSPSDSNKKNWLKILDKIPTAGPLQPAVVTSVADKSVNVLLDSDKTITIPWKGLKWARKKIGTHYLGRRPNQASDILKIGDVIYTRQLKNGHWRLEQIPEAQAALVAIDPNDGAILSLVGGFDYYLSKFNRVTQAKRQPGSSFKPFVYAAALAKGFTLSTMINDAPIVVDAPDGSIWRPQNSSRKFYGPTRLRVALMKSRNLVSVRLLQLIGIDYTINYLKNFGFDPKTLPHSLSLALGTASLTPLEIASGYTIFANGGYQVKPYFIDHIADSEGKVIYQAEPAVACEQCIAANHDTWQNPDYAWSNPDNTDDNTQAKNPPQTIPQNIAPLAITPQVAYLMTSAMQDVIKKGTGRAALVLNRKDLAGKTGTTNDKKDAWFAGFNANLVTIAWVGFDQPHSLYEYGAQAALPMWIDFMGAALKGKPERQLPEPAGLITMRIDPNTGYPAAEWQKDTIFETFRTEDAPTMQMHSNWDDPDSGQDHYNQDYYNHSSSAQESSDNDDGGGIFHIF
ncbi:MAG: peptidase [Legionellales bacterium]|nr:peptidase [Legionellales bacterium]